MQKGNSMGSLSTVSSLVIGMVSVLGTTAALGQQGQAKTESLSQLISAGYEIKNILLMGTEELKALGYEPTLPPQVLITLQKGASTAACLGAAANWLGQNPSTLENPVLCNAYNLK
jgi:hypothetical protein